MQPLDVAWLARLVFSSGVFSIFAREPERVACSQPERDLLLFFPRTGVWRMSTFHLACEQHFVGSCSACIWTLPLRKQSRLSSTLVCGTTSHRASSCMSTVHGKTSECSLMQTLSLNLTQSSSFSVVTKDLLLSGTDDGELTSSSVTSLDDSRQ